MDELGKQLVEMSSTSLKNIFRHETLSLGFTIWLKAGLPILVIDSIVGVLTSYFGFSSTPRLMLNIPTIILFWWLLQRAAGAEARSRFRIVVLGSCWWSIVWRSALYSLALSVPIMIPMLMTMTREEIEQFSEGTLNLNMNWAILTTLYGIGTAIVVLGFVVPKAYLISLRKIRSYKSMQAEFPAQGSES